VLAGNAAGVVESAIEKPVDASFKCPEDVAVSVYPLFALVVIVINCAEMFGATPLEIGREPKLIRVAEESNPEVVFSVLVHPVVFPVFAGVALLIPEIVNVKEESTVALTCTLSTVPTAVFPLSISTELASCVLRLTDQISALPAVAVFVGLISLGD
jgi:hypothetical protein